MLTSNSGATAHQALEEFHLLLRDCCPDQALPRPLAVRYQVCRAALITAPELASRLPGFIRPCVSLLKFREFIHLYHHEPAARMQFIDRSLEACWAELGQAPPRPWEVGAPPPVPAVDGPPPSVAPALPLPRDDGDDFMRDADDDDSWG